MKKNTNQSNDSKRTTSYGLKLKTNLKAGLITCRKAGTQEF